MELYINAAMEISIIKLKITQSKYDSMLAANANTRAIGYLS